MVSNRAITEAISSLTYSYVVSRGSVYLVLFIAGLNDLDIMACDIVNAYLNAPFERVFSSQQVWIMDQRKQVK